MRDYTIVVVPHCLYIAKLKQNVAKYCINVPWGFWSILSLFDQFSTHVRILNHKQEKWLRFFFCLVDRNFSIEYVNLFGIPSKFWVCKTCIFGDLEGAPIGGSEIHWKSKNKKSKHFFLEILTINQWTDFGSRCIQTERRNTQK